MPVNAEFAFRTTGSVAFRVDAETDAPDANLVIARAGPVTEPPTAVIIAA